MTTIKRFRNLFFTSADGQKLITSAAVADYFGRRHCNVIRAIKNLLSEMPDPEFGKLNFLPTTYRDDNNKQQPQYHLTRSGAMLLTMGFTGKDATALRASLFQEFKAMGGCVTPALAEANAALDRRDELLFAEFNGQNHAELSQKYSLSTRGCYKALARYRKKQDSIIQHMVNAIAADKPISAQEARELLNAAEPMLYQHTLSQLRCKLDLLDLCNSLGGKRHD